MLNRQDTQKLFSNIEEILSLHEILIKDIEREESNSNIGAIFLKMTHYFKIYSVYCSNYPAATAFLSSKKVRNPMTTLLYFLHDSTNFLSSFPKTGIKSGHGSIEDLSEYLSIS